MPSSPHHRPTTAPPSPSSQERQRLICSILSARPAIGGAGVDTYRLLAGKSWRVPLPEEEEEAELELEARAFGWSERVPLRDLPRAAEAVEELAGGWRRGGKLAGLPVPKLHQRSHAGHAAYDAVLCVHSSRARYVLSRRWVFRFPPRVLSAPPLDEVRDYFGEKVAFYFAFMHHYTWWLLYLGTPSLIALLLQLLPTASVCAGAYDAYQAALDASEERTRLRERNASLPALPVPYLVCAGAGADHALVPFYAIVACLWAALFVKYFRRFQSVLTFRWDVSDFAEEEPIRPEFYRNPATRHDRTGFYTRDAGFLPFGDVQTPYFPRKARTSRFGCSLAFTATLMVVVAAGTIGIFALRLALRTGPLLSAHLDGRTVFGYPVDASTVASLIASVLNVCFIFTFASLYRKVGVMLTDWENHRTESQYENALIQKNFLFQSVNAYISFFYIAFVKPLRPQLGEHLNEQGVRIADFDTCTGNDCMRDLVMQMVVVVLVKQLWRNLSTVLRPLIKRCCRCACLKQTRPDDELTGADKLDREMQLEPLRSLYWEYNEMAIQFGYVAMFATAAPWASFLCLINNIIELKADGARMLYLQQRPRYAGASSIGAWATVFEILSFCAIATNITLMGLTSNALTEIYGMQPKDVVVLCVVLEHVLLIWKLAVLVTVNDAPLWVRKAHAYQQWALSRGEESLVPSQYDAAALQEVYDDEAEEEADLARFWL